MVNIHDILIGLTILQIPTKLTFRNIPNTVYSIGRFGLMHNDSNVLPSKFVATTCKKCCFGDISCPVFWDNHLCS